MSSESNTSLNSLFSGDGLKILPWIAISVATILVSIYLWVFRSLPFGESPAAFGEFGDYIGGLLNPIISLFTLIVAVSVWRLQKTELLETRKAMEEQGLTADLQRREQRFFDFLNIYRSTVDSIQVIATNTAISHIGKRAFAFLTSDNAFNPLGGISALFKTKYLDAWMTDDHFTNFQSVWGKESTFLDHYFRVVFSLLREAEPMLRQDSWRYVNLLRAQLSSDEVNLFAMNLLFDEEGKKMRPLIERYGFLKHMSANMLRALAEREPPPKSFGQSYVALTNSSSLS